MHGMADMILYNGNVLTLDAKDTVAEAIAVESGKIAAVGASERIFPLAGEATNRIDVRGKTVIPGFIDAHTHNDIS